MTQYEIIIAVVATTNLVLTLISLRAARAKVAESRLLALEESLRKELREHQEKLRAIDLASAQSLNYTHLNAVYVDLKAVAAQVATLVGQQETMNELLRQLLGQQLRRAE